MSQNVPIGTFSRPYTYIYEFNKRHEQSPCFTWSKSSDEYTYTTTSWMVYPLKSELLLLPTYPVTGSVTGLSWCWDFSKSKTQSDFEPGTITYLGKYWIGSVELLTLLSARPDSGIQLPLTDGPSVKCVMYHIDSSL